MQRNFDKKLSHLVWMFHCKELGKKINALHEKLSHLVWMFHSRGLGKKMNALHQRA